MHRVDKVVHSLHVIRKEPLQQLFEGSVADMLQVSSSVSINIPLFTRGSANFRTLNQFDLYYRTDLLFLILTLF